MNTRELQIEGTLWATPSKLINLLDFKPEKLSVQKESDIKNEIKIHYIENENSGLYLVIDDLKGYFDFKNNVGYLNMLFADTQQKEKYYKVFKEILKAIGASDDSELRSATEIRLFSSDDLPMGYVFKINTMTIVVRAVVEKDNKFYSQISLNHCSYEV